MDKIVFEIEKIIKYSKIIDKIIFELDIKEKIL